MTMILTYIVPFVVLLGILVFVHEAGHFLVAKYFGIKVERFSIGFGPRIFGKTVGDTEYRVAWIPLGGYVKMAGDDPTDDEAREIPGSFMGAKLWKRMLVVVAGPAVNLILPIFVIAGIYMVGKEFAASYVGHVNAGSPAAEAGLQVGDRVVEVEGDPVQRWDEMTARIRAAEGPVDVTVERDGERMTFSILAETRDVPDEFGIDRKVPIIGVGQFGTAPVVQPVPGSPAESAGLKTGDKIVRIGEQEVRYWNDLEDAVASLAAGPVEIAVERRPPLPLEPDARLKAMRAEPEKATLTVEATGSGLEGLGVRSADLVVARIEPDSPAEAAGFVAGDRILAIAGQPATNRMDFMTWLSDQAGKKSTFTVERDGRPLELALTPVTKKTKIPGTSRMDENVWAGLDLHGEFAPPPRIVVQYRNPLRALVAGVQGTGESIWMNISAFQKIFAREIPLRESLGGPIAIADVTGVAYQSAGMSGFLTVLIHMSVILGIMNLLPIPVLDGGHLAFFTIEAILRRPPPVRVRELAQQAGLLLLLAVMAFVLVNDVVTRI